MAKAFTGSMRINALGTLTDVTNIGANLTESLSYVQQKTFSNGTGINQCNEMWSDTRTLTASSTESLDLSGVLVDDFGDSVAFTSIKAILVSASAENTNNVVIGGAASNAFGGWVNDTSDKIVVHPGGIFCIVAPDAAGYPVTADTGDLLKVANSSSGTSVTYDIVIYGTI